MGKLPAHSWSRNSTPRETYDFFHHISDVFPPLPFPVVMLIGPTPPDGGGVGPISMTPGNGRGGRNGEKNRKSAER